MATARPLTLATRREGPATIVTAGGELDAATVQEFVWAVDGALAEAPPVLCLDLAAVAFADSSALAALVRTRRMTAWRGTVLTVVAGAGGVGRLIDLTRMDRLLDVYPTVAAALALTGGSLGAEAARRRLRRLDPLPVDGDADADADGRHLAV